MQITPILICLVLISIVQTALVTKIPKPKLSLVQSQNLQIAEPPKHKSPEERRKFSLFPKSYMKYVISSEPIYKIATHKPIVHGTKKSLMKKLNLLDKKNIAVENESQQPTINAEPVNENNLDVTPKVNSIDVSEELSNEIVEQKSQESNEKQNDDSEEEVEEQNFSNEIKKSTVDTANKETPNLKDLIVPPEAKPVVFSEVLSKEIVEEKSEKNYEKQYDSKEEDKLQNDSSKIKIPKADAANKESTDLKDQILLPETKPVEVSTENKNLEAFDEKKNSEENETPDWTEFIFIDPAHKTTKNNSNSEEPEEYTTTEFYVETENIRIKRGSNVIEEENLASTVAGYKYTWKDTRLSNDVAFKNIHS